MNGFQTQPNQNKQTKKSYTSWKSQAKHQITKRKNKKPKTIRSREDQERERENKAEERD
jgi:hypothetical protein